MNVRTILSIFSTFLVMYIVLLLVEGSNSTEQKVSYDDWKRSKYECDVLIFEKHVFDHMELEAWENSLRLSSCDVEVGGERVYELSQDTD